MSIIVENLSFAYKKDYVLNDISFELEEDMLISVLGKNGAGKSTLFKCMLGLLKPKSGNIYIDNEDIKKLSAKKLSRKIAYIPQVHSPHFNYRVVDVVIMGLSSQINIFSSPSDEDFAKAMQVLKYLEIEDISDKGYLEISGGQRQLVMIARAMLQDAKIFIMDEPTSNLDYGNQIKLMQKVKQLSRQGYIILMSTHNPQHCLSFSDKALILSGGKVLKVGNTKDTIDEKVLSKLYKIDMKLKNIDDMKVCIPAI